MQAEQDRDVYRRAQAAIAREKQIMSDVPGWEVSALTSLAAYLLTHAAGREERIQHQTLCPEEHRHFVKHKKGPHAFDHLLASP